MNILLIMHVRTPSIEQKNPDTKTEAIYDDERQGGVTVGEESCDREREHRRSPGN